MVEIRYPESWTPASAPEWFANWERVRDEPELTIIANPRQGRAAPVVLIASSYASRRRRNLNTNVRWEGELEYWLDIATEPAIHTIDHGVTHESDHESRHTPLHSIPTLTQARRAADLLAESLEARTPAVGPSIVRMARFVMEELGANIVQHSGEPHTGFGWADVDSSDRRLELSFADSGVGILTSLQRNPELAGGVHDHAEALQLALTARVSGTGAGRSNMGWGLKALVDFSDLLAGDLYVASGDTMLVRRTIGGQRANTLRSIPAWHGTWICLDAPLR